MRQHMWLPAGIISSSHIQTQTPLVVCWAPALDCTSSQQASPRHAVSLQGTPTTSTSRPRPPWRSGTMTSV